MTYLKGLTKFRFTTKMVAIKVAIGAAFLGFAVSVPVSEGPLASAAQAKGFPKSCGREGQRPCKVWEHIPSCAGNLVERPLGKKCSKPKKINPPKILPKPEEVRGCGAAGQRPCKITQAFPSCEGRLAEDFIKNICRTEDSALARKASNAFRELKPLIQTIGGGAIRCGVDTVVKGANQRSPRDVAEQLLGMPCFEGLLKEARRNGYRTLTVGGSGSAALLIGGEGENGFAFDTSGNRQVRTFHTLSLKFLSLGAGTAVNIGLYKAAPKDLAGDAHGVSVGAAVVGGGGTAIWYNYNSDAVAGLTAVITAGGSGEIAYVRNTTKTVDVFNATPRRTVTAPPPAPKPQQLGWSGRPIDGNYAARDDKAKGLMRYFTTEGDRNQKLWYRYKVGNAKWSNWRSYKLVKSGSNFHHYMRTDDSGSSFTVYNNGQRIEYKANQRRDAYGFSMKLVQAFGQY